MIDIIIVNWNDRDNLATALDSVFALSEIQRDPEYAAVTVSDNGSKDGSLDMLRERYGKRVAVIENDANLGFGAGVNRAISQTGAPFIFLLNPDATVRDGALTHLVAFMNAHPRCAIAGPKLYEAGGRVAESCGEFDTWIGAFLRSSAWGDLPFLRRFANGARLRAWDYTSERRVDLVIGAAMLLRRAVLDRIGAFDERYFMYHEEIDLGKRVADAGFESWFVPSAQATHTGKGSSAGRSVEAYKQRSRRYYWIKHHGRLWYYSLSVALIARYLLYLGIVGGVVLLIRRLLNH
ncbi:MAG TPA: glycosyltransferase family 2 protein [Verrucomicrobiae bacterium]|jgi:GT2 family glycosyltransferase|nr:glycosyltransferase family 2 protein [Verrucomicrobiae bacterium]